MKRWEVLFGLGVIFHITLGASNIFYDQYLRNCGYVWLVRGMMSVNQTELGTAKQIFNSLIEKTYAAYPVYGLALVAEVNGNDQQAIVFWTELVQRSPDNILGYFHLGNAWFRAGDEERAVEIWRKANAHSYWTMQGDEQRREGDQLSALQSYHLALSIYPYWPPAIYGMSRALHTQINGLWTANIMQNHAAIPLLSQVLNFIPNEFDYIRLGDYSRLNGDTEKALEWYKKGIILFPNSALLYQRVAKIEASRGNFSEAEDILKKALKLDKKNEAIYLDLGWVYFRQGKHSLAESFLLSSIDIEPSQWSYAHLGDVYIAQGRTDDAIAAYQHALAIMPDFAYAQQKLQNLAP